MVCTKINYCIYEEIKNREILSMQCLRGKLSCDECQIIIKNLSYIIDLKYSYCFRYYKKNEQLFYIDLLKHSISVVDNTSIEENFITRYILETKMTTNVIFNKTIEYMLNCVVNVENSDYDK